VEYAELTPEQGRGMSHAWAQPEWRAVLKGLGVLRTMGPEWGTWSVPARDKDYILELVAAWLEAGQPSQAEPARPVDTAALAAEVVEAIKRQARGSPRKPAKRGVKETEVSDELRRQLAQLRIEGAGVAEITRETKLSKWIATRLVDDVDDALREIRAGRY
jgi:hypothetical protein